LCSVLDGHVLCAVLDGHVLCSVLDVGYVNFP